MNSTQKMNEFEDDTELNEGLGEDTIEQESWNIFEDEVAIDDDEVPGDEKASKDDDNQEKKVSKSADK